MKWDFFRQLGDGVTRFLDSPLTKHALVVALLQFLLAALLAYFLAERWQRWRQRRDFQFQTMVKFNNLSAEAFNRLSELLMARSRIPDDHHNRLRREYLYQRIGLLAMDGELFAAFRDAAVFQGLVDLKNIMRVLYHMACAPTPVPRSQFEPIQSCMTAQRRVMQTRMIQEMGFFSRRGFRHFLRTWEPRTRLPPSTSLPAEDGNMSETLI